MKIRNGFVSNSSSSSFICDVCGTVESGMDAGASDFDMSSCVNGHTFCNGHTSDSVEMTPKQFRDEIRSRIENRTWLSKERIQSDISEMELIPDDEIEDFRNENYSDDGIPECPCPICTFKSLDKNDGYEFLKKKFSMNDKDVLDSMKVHFKTYSELRDFVKEEQINK